MTLRVRLCHLSVTAAVAAMLAVPHPAKGAVRVCKGPISSAVAIEKSEKAKAGLSGMEYTSWRLAADKRLACTAVKGQGHACLAHGSPCIIKQVPPFTGSGPKPIPG